MKDEFTDRLLAIKQHLQGQTVEQVCHTLHRSRDWFHRWCRRYRALGPDGLFELTRAHVPTQRLSPELERTILTIRRRLESVVHPGTRYSLVGAHSILAELKALQVRPLPCARTIERILQRHGETLPRVKLAPLVSQYNYPAPQATDSNHVHQVDCVGPVYLVGQRKRHYIWTCKHVYGGAVCLDLSHSRRMEAVLVFLGQC